MNEIAVVTEQDIPDILRMIHEIYSELPNKEWFSLDSDEEVTSYMMTGGFGLKAMCDGRLAGVFIARAKNLGDENLGYDLKFDEEQRKQSAHMEIAMVRKEYRGQGLQRKMMEESEQILKEQGYQLKAIKVLLPEIEQGHTPPAIVPAPEPPISDKMEQFQMILGKVVSQALKANQLEMGKELSHQVSTQVVKEMDYLFRLQEEREETHYKNLDAQLRATQQKAQKKKRLQR